MEWFLTALYRQLFPPNVFPLWLQQSFRNKRNGGIKAFIQDVEHWNNWMQPQRKGNKCSWESMEDDKSFDRSLERSRLCCILVDNRWTPWKLSLTRDLLATLSFLIDLLPPLQASHTVTVHLLLLPFCPCRFSCYELGAELLCWPTVLSDIPSVLTKEVFSLLLIAYMCLWLL